MVLYSQWFSGISPFEGVCSVLVVVLDIMHDLFHEFLFGMPDATLDNIPGEDSEPDFHLVQPGCVRRSKVKGEPASVRNPFKDFVMFVSTEIVRDNMNVFARVLSIQTCRMPSEEHSLSDQGLLCVACHFWDYLSSLQDPFGEISCATSNRHSHVTPLSD